ncbi:MAG: sensor histidine kinase [Myxococcaceae bacterium]
MRKPNLRMQLALWFGLAVALSLAIFSAAVITAIWLDEEAEHAAETVPTPSDVADDLRRVLWAMLAAAPFGIGGAMALGYFVAGRALAPLREADARARAAHASSELDLRLPVTGRDDEWDALANTMNELLATARKSMERIRGFTADAAHELRTPLTAIMGEADVTLRRERTPEELRAALTTIRGEAARLADIIAKLLVLARADEQKLLAQRMPVDLLQVAKKAAARWTPNAVQSNRSVTVTGESTEAQADPALLEHLFDNLINNALTHGGGAVKVSVNGQNGDAKVRVSDDGSGIPDELAPTVFERFVRGDASRSGGGFGLGLSLALEIARAHGGTLVLESARAPTSFLVTLPRQAGVKATGSA